MIGHGLPIYVALEPVDMRMGYERLGGLVRERMHAEPRSKALFVFVGKRGHTSAGLAHDQAEAALLAVHAHDVEHLLLVRQERNVFRRKRIIG